MQNKSLLITGASSGIGRAFSLAAIDAGAQVTGVARNMTKVEQSIRKIELDLADLSALQQAFKTEPLLLENYDALVLCAGQGLFGGLEQFAYDDIERVVNINYLSNLFLIKHFLPGMKKRRSGDIVLLGSEAALSGAKQGSVYCSTKFALRGLAQSLRADLVSAGMRVMLVNPGPVDTAFFDELHFAPKNDDQHRLAAQTVAEAIIGALSMPAGAVIEEIRLQPLKRAFVSKVKCADQAQR